MRANFFTPAIYENSITTYPGEKIRFETEGKRVKCLHCNPNKSMSKDRKISHVYYYHLPKPDYVEENKDKIFCTKCKKSLKRYYWIDHCYNNHDDGPLKAKDEYEDQIINNLSKFMGKSNERQTNAKQTNVINFLGEKK